ncbi:TMEM131_like domain-containing protein [Psidium guajava]|nr:TMEM131_like domain-containing protein [Psidium guajava]
MRSFPKQRVGFRAKPKRVDPRLHVSHCRGELRQNLTEWRLLTIEDVENLEGPTALSPSPGFPLPVLQSGPSVLFIVGHAIFGVWGPRGQQRKATPPFARSWATARNYYFALSVGLAWLIRFGQGRDKMSLAPD